MSKEVLLEALELLAVATFITPKLQAKRTDVINAGLQALEPAQQQEPVAWMHPDGRIWTFGRGLDKSTFTIPLYTSPPAQRAWEGLTDDEIAVLDVRYHRDTWRLIKESEAKLKEKNT